MKKVYLLAFVAALLAGALTYVYFTQLSGEKTVETPMADVVVAAVDVPAYTTIDKSMVKVVQVPASAAHAQAAQSLDQVVGKQSASQFVAGEQIIARKLATAETVGSSLSYQLDDGRYAFSVDVRLAAGGAGYVTDGDHVNILGARYDSDGVAYESAVLLENVEVLRVGDNTRGADDKEYDTITLSLTYDQCLELHLYLHAESSEVWAALCQRKAEVGAE